jgi:hypothetical protein
MSESSTPDDMDFGNIGQIVRGFLEYVAGAPDEDADEFPSDERFLKWSYGDARERAKMIAEYLEGTEFEGTEAAGQATQLLLGSTFVEVRYFLNNPGAKVWLCIWIGH